MKWEEVIKNQIAVTTGKTKTVDQPLVEDDDDDCVRVFSELFNRLSKKAAPIFKSIPVIELSPSELLNMYSEKYWCSFREECEIKGIVEFNGFTIKILSNDGQISFNFRDLEFGYMYDKVPFSLEVEIENYKEYPTNLVTSVYRLYHDSQVKIDFSEDKWIGEKDGKKVFLYGNVAINWTFPFVDSMKEFYLDIVKTMNQFSNQLNSEGNWAKIELYIINELYPHLYDYIIYTADFDNIIGTDFKKSVARTVTTGKTKTVDLPLYEEDDEDCFEYFNKEIIEPFIDLAYETMPNNTRLYYEDKLRNHFTPEQWCALWYEGELVNSFQNRYDETSDYFEIVLPIGHQHACFINFHRIWRFVEGGYELLITSNAVNMAEGVTKNSDLPIIFSPNSFQPEQIGLLGYVDILEDYEVADKKVEEVLEDHRQWVLNHLRSYENWRYKVATKIKNIKQFSALSMDGLLDLWPASYGGEKW